MISPQVLTAQPYALYLVPNALQITSSLFNSAQHDILTKDDRRFRLLNYSEHVVPQVLFGNIHTMRSSAEGLTGEPSAQDIKSSTNFFAIQFCNICMAINIHALIHPPVFFPLRKYPSRIRHNFNSPNTFVMKQSAPINATADTGKKVEFFYAVDITTVCRF